MSQNHDDQNADPTKNSKKRGSKGTSDSENTSDSGNTNDTGHAFEAGDADGVSTDATGAGKDSEGVNPRKSRGSNDFSDGDDTNEDQHAKSKNDSASGAEKQQVKIDFPFSDVVRAQIPKAFETAEKVATEVKHHWKTEGDFANLGLPHPVADMVATQALQKAKEVEKKLEEKGVFNLAKMGLEIAKSQFESFKKKI